MAEIDILFPGAGQHPFITHEGNQAKIVRTLKINLRLSVEVDFSRNLSEFGKLEACGHKGQD